MYPSAPPQSYGPPQPYPKYGEAAPVPVPVPPPNPSSRYISTPTPATMTMHVQPSYRPAGQWSSGLCHCFDDPANCLITCVCPCITFGQIADIVDRGTCSCGATGATYGLLLGTTGLACLYSCFYRSKLRGEYDLEEGPVPDCLVHFCCETCALCQEYRELKNRGFDMGIGWDANVDRQRRGVMGSPVMGAPSINAGMTR